MGNVSFLFLYDLMPRNYRLPCMITCYGLCMVMSAYHKVLFGLVTLYGVNAFLV